MELLFAGTGAADYETPFRCECAHCTAIRRRGARNLRHYASLLLDGRLLLDCGPTVPWRLAELDVPPAQVEALVITHSHEDHLDLPAVTDLLQARGSDRDPLVVLGNPESLQALASLGERVAPVVATPGHAVEVLGRTLLPVAANHVAQPGETTLNWLLQYEAGWLWYGTDTGWPLPETMAVLAEVKPAAAVVEATFGLTDNEGYPGCLTHHMNWPEFLRLREHLLAEGILAAEAPYLATHLSLHFAPIHDDLCREAVPPVVLAYDGLRVTL